METKQRHGCVTTWLVIMIIANSITALIYLFASETILQNMLESVSRSIILLLAVICILNVIFSVMLLQWKKWGFWGFLITSFGALIINLNIGISAAQSVFGLAGIAILYGILQIKKDNVTAWQNLE